MKKDIVIVGSASLQDKIYFWKQYWEKNNYNVINFPKPIEKEIFLKKYPEVHSTFFKDISNSDTLFIMNEDKNGIKGYIGAESFAEMCFGVTQNLNYDKNIEILLLQNPGESVQSYDEIMLWLKLGWIKLHKK